jgi:hypothetical protein
MFVVTEADAAAIRALYQQRGEFAAAIELRRRFPGITDNAQARSARGPLTRRIAMRRLTQSMNSVPHNRERVVRWLSS